MSAREAILVVGATGYIGRRLVERLGERAIATCCATPATRAARFDVTSMHIHDAVPDLERVSHAVLLHGITSPNRCFEQPERAHAVNVTGTQELVEDLARAGVVAVFASTESVFDGTKGGYTEDDEPHPLMLYARQKHEMERWLVTRDLPHAVLRLASVVGDQPGDGTLFTAWMHDIGHARTLRCAYDQRFSPIHVEDAVTGIIATCERDLRGCYHLCGPDSLSRVEMLEQLVARSGLDARIERCSLREFATPEPRPLDVTLDGTKLARATSLAPRSVAGICDAVLARHDVLAGAGT